MTLTKLSAVFGITLAVFSVTVHAEAVLSNFYRPYTYDFGVGNYSDSIPYLAQSFQTGSTSLDLWRVDTITLMMGAIIGKPDAPFELAIYSDAGNLPGEKIGMLSGPARPNVDMSEQVFTGAILLNPNAQYWIIASSPSAEARGAYRWGGNDYTSFWIQKKGWGIDSSHAIAISSNGTQWTPFDISKNGIGYLFFDIEATAVAAVPEPTVLGLLGVGAGVLLRRFRRRAA